ncbi:ribosome small subunit-dependent GTPase A [Cellulomonas sp. NPDC055163]
MDEQQGGPVVRVVRVDRHAVLVLPTDAAGTVEPAPGDGPAVHEGGSREAAPDADPAARGVPVPQRVALDRDGLAPTDDGTRLAPTVGDMLVLDERPGAPARVARLVPRRTALVRDSADRTSLTQALAANVDVVVVAEHLDPEPDLGRVERLLTLAWRSGAQPVVVLTKADLAPDADAIAAEVADAAIGVGVHVVSATRGTGLDPLRALLTPGTTIVVVGPSGAGKSTLVNALAGREVMATGESRADGRGRHTTVHRELVALGGGAMLIDTPGVRGVGLVADADALSTTFPDVEELAAECRFRDCAHASEPGCAVREALAAGDLPQRRFASWQRLAREAAFQARRADARLAAEQRAQVRRTTVEHHRGQRAAPRR